LSNYTDPKASCLDCCNFSRHFPHGCVCTPVHTHAFSLFFCPLHTTEQTLILHRQRCLLYRSALESSAFHLAADCLKASTGHPSAPGIDAGICWVLQFFGWLLHGLPSTRPKRPGGLCQCVHISLLQCCPQPGELGSCAWARRPLTFRKISVSKARARNKKIFLFKGQSRRLLKRYFQVCLLGCDRVYMQVNVSCGGWQGTSGPRVCPMHLMAEAAAHVAMASLRFPEVVGWCGRVWGLVLMEGQFWGRDLCEGEVRRDWSCTRTQCGGEVCLAHTGAGGTAGFKEGQGAPRGQGEWPETGAVRGDCGHGMTRNRHMEKLCVDMKLCCTFPWHARGCFPCVFKAVVHRDTA